MNIESPNRIKDKIVAVLEFVNNFNDTLGMRIIKKIQDVAGALRSAHYIAIEADVIINSRIAQQVEAGAKDLRTIAELSSPFGATRLLSIFSVFRSLPNFVNSIVEFDDAKGGKKKFNKFLEIINSSTAVIGNAESIMYGINAVHSAIQVTELALKIFAGANFVNAIVSNIQTGMSIYKTHKTYKKLKEIDSRDHKALTEFLKNDKNLAILGIEKKDKFKTAFQDLTENVLESNQNVDSLIKDLKGRLKTKQGFHAINIINNCVTLAQSALIIASIAFPPLLTISIIFSAGILISTFLYENISNYQFENKMGMIERMDDYQKAHLALWKVKDYIKWNFNNLISNN